MVFAKWTRVVTITALHKMWKGDIVKQASLNGNMVIVAWCICVQDKWYLQSEPPPNGNSHIPESFTQSILLPPPLMEWVWDKGKDIFWSKPLDCFFMSSIYIFFSSHLTIESISVRRNSPFLPRAHGHFIKSLLFLHYITLTHPPHWSKEPNFSHQRIYPTFSGHSFIRQANFGCDHFGQPFQIVSLEHCEFWESKAYHTNKENKILFQALVMVFSECSEFLTDVLETFSDVLKRCTDVIRCSQMFTDVL